MSQNTSPLNGDCEIIAGYLKRNLETAGYQVIRSFDLQRARGTHTECTCPHHGKAQCNCQMIVLLVYLSDGEPHTLTVHGHDSVTNLNWGENLSESEEEALFPSIKDVFAQVKRFQDSEIPESS